MYNFSNFNHQQFPHEHDYFKLRNVYDVLPLLEKRRGQFLKTKTFILNFESIEQYLYLNFRMSEYLLSHLFGAQKSQ